MARILTGIVVGDKAQKTITISVVSKKTHPIYKKQYTQSKKFMAHDEKSKARLGDLVTVVETRPISSKKRFVLKDIIREAPIEHKETTSSGDES